MQVDSNIEAWIVIWEAVTLPVWRFVLWPVEAYTALAIPDWMLNYGTVGLVIYGMSLRFFFFFSDPDSRIRVAGTSEGWGLGRYIVLLLFCLFCWPAWMLYVFAVNVMYLFGLTEVFRDKEDPNYLLFGEGLKVFWETAVWFVLLIAINYALLYKNGELRWQAAETFIENNSSLLVEA